jgi:hypothetical protein
MGVVRAFNPDRLRLGRTVELGGGGRGGEPPSLHTIVFFVMLFSLSWGWHVFKNVLHFTVAVSFWWLFDHRPHLYGVYDSRRTVVDSLRRASAYSFGSICTASLLNSLAEALENLISSSRTSRGCYAMTLLAYVLSCLLA